MVPFLQPLFRTFLTPCILSGYHSLSCRERCHYSLLTLLVGVVTAIAPTWAARRRGSFLAFVWHTDFATTYSRDTVIIYRPPSLLHASLSPPPLSSPFTPPPVLRTTMTCLPATMQATWTGCGPPRAPTRRLTTQEANARYHARSHARDPATRDEESLRTRGPTTKARTGCGRTTQAHYPTGSTRWFARRRRKNLHRARLDTNSRLPRESATSWPPSARQSSTTATSRSPVTREAFPAPQIGFGGGAGLVSVRRRKSRKTLA